ncbi:NAD-glutamate dehydrogenase domain-containing protein [Sphingomonas sp. KC8]|uniref:NAD-glutamate dehydrogenase domain-containing protein n=1 Tax=Sphingomonas sp. KC8 TaxID=1030157 RepID=UPI0002488AD1|nr:NAD-glutamate dehydrogenase domain-containing protein [Sphingomonas sp. KC8]ARS27707.1 NAD-specific glutamate dehydrogenase [Sphingomonas sp. KC8]
MPATSPTPADTIDDSIATAIGEALTRGALPGETDGLSDEERAAAAGFVSAAAAERPHGRALVRLESAGGEEGRRRMRLAVINDDMPFLVDSVAGAVGAHGLAIHRLLHPVVPVRRDGDGRLTAVLPADASGERRESIIYMEIERADARTRRALTDELEAVLADARAAVTDWPRLQIALRDDADRLPDGEGAALLRWFGDRHFTLLGHRIELADGSHGAALGILANPKAAIWSEESRQAALARFETGGEAPLILKADRIATVHRRVPMDLIVLPHRVDGRIAGVSVHAGLWTSAALRAPSDKVPVLRARLTALDEKYAFDPSGHAGKALRHALSSLPHDILVAVGASGLETLALAAMSLADRPRPKLVLVSSALERHLFAFVWLPRDDLSTGRRVTIGKLLEEQAGATISSWAIELGDGDVALIRYTLDLKPGAAIPDAAALDIELKRMVRGWNPAVEAALAEQVGAGLAARMTLAFSAAFPPAYRERYPADEAGRDIICLRALNDADDRSARLYRLLTDDPRRLRLKCYRLGGLIPLSDAVPVLEAFGFRVLKETPTALDAGALGYIHEYLLELDETIDPDALMARAGVAEQAIAAVLAGHAENDAFNQLIVTVGLDPQAVILFRAWFRYLRQTGLAYGLDTVAQALRKAPVVARRIIDLFAALHDPQRAGTKEAKAAEAAIDAALANVAAIDDDRILRRIRAVVQATLRSNAFAPAAQEALAFKLDSASIPGLPAPRPWREIWVYSPRVEGIHLRGGPIARGGLRWSDRRDDFRTEILGLMKAQLVKNAVIVPTGAKGGFYPKQLPSPAVNRDAWLAEGTESYRIFIRSLLSVTDNIIEDKIIHPEKVVIRDDDDPYFVVAADKGTASFSDVANAIALDRKFWLGDAFASGGSQGYDHKAMGITARGAWVSVQRHFLEMGVDVQKEPIIVAGCGDMSGDVFGNGMLLSKTLKIVAAFDHRHIFLDPDPDPAASWKERARLFKLPRSSWDDYDAGLISKGGGVFPRTQKEIPVSKEAAAILGIAAGAIDPSTLIAAILKSPVDLLWFGGIGTYIKSRDENNAEVGDPANDAHRVNGEDVRAKAIGEGANLGVTQAGRIGFAAKGGRINTDFIDNSAGVDCSDNEVNIKIPLNREMIEGRLTFDDRNALLVSMTNDVAALVLEDNRLQTLGLSLAQRGGAAALPAQVRVIEMMEAAGRIDRIVEGLDSSDELLRRAQDQRGLTRPELAILLSHGKLALQAAIELTDLADDPLLTPLLHAGFPAAMRDRFATAIDQHRLRGAIIATRMANRVVNRLGLIAPFELAEEEGISLAQVAAAYFAADAIFGLEGIYTAIEQARLSEDARFQLLEATSASARLHIADLIRVGGAEMKAGEIAGKFGEGVSRLDAAAETLLRHEARVQADALRERLLAAGADGMLVKRIVRLDELDGAVGTAALAQRLGVDEVAATTAYVRLGEALGLDWAKAAAIRFVSSDPWERLLAAGLARDFEQLRLDFLTRSGKGDPLPMVETWLKAHDARVTQFRGLVDRARTAPAPTAAMLAQIASQARGLLIR